MEDFSLHIEPNGGISSKPWSWVPEGALEKLWYCLRMMVASWQYSQVPDWNNWKHVQHQHQFFSHNLDHSPVRSLSLFKHCLLVAMLVYVHISFNDHAHVWSMLRRFGKWKVPTCAALSRCPACCWPESDDFGVRKSCRERLLQQWVSTLNSFGWFMVTAILRKICEGWETWATHTQFSATR